MTTFKYRYLQNKIDRMNFETPSRKIIGEVGFCRYKLARKIKSNRED